MRGISVLLFLVGVAVARSQVNECPTEQENNWHIEQLLRHEDCHKFYKCTFGHPVEYTCPSDLYFNLESWACDWTRNVDCEGRNDPALTTVVPDTPKPTTPEPTTQEPTTPEPTTSEPPTPDPTTPEPTTPEPTTPEPTTPEPTTPEPTTPEPTTPEPTTPEPTTPKPTTPEPTTPEPTTTTTTKRPQCEVEVWPQPEPQPEPQPQPQPQPQPEPELPTEIEVDFLPNGCPVDPHIHWLVPHAEDCTLFYYCVWGELVLRECPSGLHFNPAIQVCDWPTNAGCSVSVNKHAEVRRRLLNEIFA